MTFRQSSPTEPLPKRGGVGRTQARPLAVVIAISLALLVSGCAGDGGAGQPKGTQSASAGRRDVDVVDLFVSPSPVDFDGEVGSDGLLARVMLFQQRQAQAVASRQGRIVLSLYAGSVSPAKLRDAPPLHDWTFQGDSLKRMARPSAVGVVYAFPLPWRDGHMPPVTRVSLAARYESASGEIVWSKPTTISLTAR